jgi:hypothetical protein
VRHGGESGDGRIAADSCLSCRCEMRQLERRLLKALPTECQVQTEDYDKDLITPFFFADSEEE